MSPRRSVGVGLGAAAVVATLFATATPAQAANGTVGQREVVCAQSLSVRTEPLGAWMGSLSYPETFYVKQVSGSWVYGFAYGHVNRNGWVQNGWFC